MGGGQPIDAPVPIRTGAPPRTAPHRPDKYVWRHATHILDPCISGSCSPAFLCHLLVSGRIWHLHARVRKMVRPISDS